MKLYAGQVIKYKAKQRKKIMKMQGEMYNPQS